MEKYEYGREEVVFVKAETAGAYGTIVKPVATDGLVAIRAKFTPLKEFIPRTDRAATRSLLKRIPGRTSATWEIEAFLVPSGTAGTAPDVGPLLKAGFGAEQEESTYVDYSLLNDISDLSLTMYKQTGMMQEGVNGAMVNELTLTWTGTDLARLRFAGPAQDYVWTGNGTANGPGVASPTLILQDGEAYGFSVGSIIQIADDDNTGAGYLVTAVNYTTHTLTLETSTNWADGAVVKPFLPTPTTAGSPVFGALGSLSFDGGTTDMKDLGGEVRVVNNLVLRDDEHSDTKPYAVVLRGKREVTFRLDFIAKSTPSELTRIGWASEQLQRDIQLVIGKTAGSILTVNLDQAELNVHSPDVPESEEVRMSVDGVALGSTAEDEGTFVFT